MMTSRTYPQTTARHRLPYWSYYVLIWVALGTVASVAHLNAIGLVDTPGQTPVSTLQALTAVIANTLGPWAGHIVRLVDFPNAGLRGFQPLAAITMTAAVIALLVVGAKSRQRWIRATALGGFSLLMLLWYAYGFLLIADGLL